MVLSGKIAVVTGASRGIGRGIALQLGEAGATVYVTGRQPQESMNSQIGLGGLEETAEEITRRGGRGIARFVDHTDAREVENFFAEIEREHNGQLDILVNNAYQGFKAIADNHGKAFYETDPSVWDTVNDVGLRNNYYCSVYAARMMAARKRGLIVNVSSHGGLSYMFNVAYGVGKGAVDRLTSDMAVELKNKNVCVVSIWPGAVRTELSLKHFMDENGRIKKEMDSTGVYGNGETVEYPGKGIVAIASDPHRMKKTGRVFITEDLGSEYGFLDIDGQSPPNMRSIHRLLLAAGWTGTARLFPEWIKMPGWILYARESKF